MDELDDFEKQLNQLAPRKPSAALDERIAAALTGDASAANVIEIEPRRTKARAARAGVISRRWAMAACLAVGLVGFAAGRLTQPRDASSRGAEPSSMASVARDEPAVAVHVIFESQPTNPFDCTTASDDNFGTPAKVQTKVEDPNPKGAAS